MPRLDPLVEARMHVQSTRKRRAVLRNIVALGFRASTADDHVVDHYSLPFDLHNVGGIDKLAVNKEGKGKGQTLFTPAADRGRSVRKNVAPFRPME